MDTPLILRDTITTNVVKVVDSCQPCIQEAETNWQDVTIVGIICFLATVSIVIISFAFYKWQKAKYQYLVFADNQKHLHEIEKGNLEASRIAEKEAKERAEKEEKQKAEKDEKEKTKSDYKIAGEFFKQVCDATKDKEGKFDNAALKTLIEFFQKEWGKSQESKDKNGSSNEKSQSQNEEEKS